MKDVEKLSIRDDDAGTVLAVKVVPGASRNKLAGVLGDALKITVSAAPEKGKANTAVAAVLAKAMGIERRDVQLVSGMTSPRKEFRIAGLRAAAVRDALAEL